MTVSVLGALVVDGGPISPRERSMLAVLVLEVGSTVSPDVLADAVWGEHPPATWPKQVQIAIARLRRHPGVPTIDTLPDGYRLAAPVGSIDAGEFERLVALGAQHAGDGHDDRAEASFMKALSLWRGAPYLELADWPTADAERLRLVELREFAQEELLASRLALGRAPDVVGDGERLVREAPLRERRWELLAIALYRSGRQADALAALREAGRRFDDELGIELSERLHELETGMLRHDPALATPAGAPAAEALCPYRGLDAFDADDEEAFFGRDAEIAAALERLERTPFVAFSGSSGCGKSSLLRAGVVPALRRRGHRVEVLLPRRGFTAALPDRLAELRAGDVIVIDQFEEVLQLGLRLEDVESIGAQIAGFVDAGGSVALTVRSDRLDECAALPRLGALFAGGVQLVPSMGAGQLREAIVGPADAAGLRVEPGLVELVLRDAVGRPGVLPLVSHALVETWLRRDGATLTVAGYESAGGLSGAIAQSADRMYRTLSPAERNVCRSTMLRLVALGADGTPVRRTVPTGSMHDDETRIRVLARLTDARLVNADDQVVVVAHEALADAWPRLRGWLDQDRAALRIMHAVTTAAESWEAGGRLDEDLARGARLQAALEWADGAERDLTATESAFLAASAEHEASDRRGLEARARADRRQNRRLRSLLAAAAALILALVGVGTFAGYSASEAERQRSDAAIEALVGKALSLRDSERDVAALLAAEAYRRWPDDPRTRAGLMGFVTGMGGFLGNAFIDGATGAFGAVIPDTRTALIATGDGDIAVRDIEDAAIVRELELGFEPVALAPPPLVVVSADGGTGAVLWPERVNPEVGVTWYGTATSSLLTAFDLADGRRVFGPERIGVGPGALAIDEHGTTIAAAASSNGSVRLIDPATGDVRRIPGERTVPLDHDTVAAALAFDGGRLYAGRTDDRIDEIDLSAATIVRTISVPPSTAHRSIVVGGEGLLLASGERGLIALATADGHVRWKTDLPASLPASCATMTLSEEAGRVFCGGTYGRIEAYALADGRALARLDARLGDVGPMTTIDDGRELVSISPTGPAILRWRLDGGGPAHRLIAPGWYATGGYSGSGSLLVANPREGAPPNDEGIPVAAIIDTATGEVVRRFDGGLGDPAWGDGRRLVGREPGGGYRLFDADSGRAIGDLPAATYRVWSSPDRRRVYAAQDDWSIVTVDGTSGDPSGPALSGPDGFPVGVAGSPDGALVAVIGFLGAGRVVTGLLDARTGEMIDEGGLHLATVADDGSIVDFAEDRITLRDSFDDDSPQSLAGTAGGLGIGTLSADGRSLLVTAGDQSVQLFDLPSGVRIGAPFTADAANLTGGFLRPDGGELAVTVADGIMIWDLDPDHQFDAVCRIAGRNLTEQEWRTYLPGFDGPQRTCR